MHKKVTCYSSFLTLTAMGCKEIINDKNIKKTLKWMQRKIDMG